MKADEIYQEVIHCHNVPKVKELQLPPSSYFTEDERELFDWILQHKFGNGKSIKWQLFQTYWKEYGFQKLKETGNHALIYYRTISQLKTRRNTKNGAKSK
jgi:two-component SAPR family response regulator